MAIRTAFVSTYPPRRCGIAAFTSDLLIAVGGGEVVALHPSGGPTAYPAEVRHVIRRDDATGYERTARRLSASAVDVVSIQHEFGIWGGTHGANVLDFVRALDIPAVSTLHTVLPSPPPAQRRIVRELGIESAATVVMSRSAARLLAERYDVDPARIQVLPHGVPDLDLVDPDGTKPGLDLAGRRVVLSFGLLGPGKGYESVIDALAAVVPAIPNVCYVVLGVTHPDLVSREGEAYRRGLKVLAAARGVADHVCFVDRFVDVTELGRWLKAADVFVTPYPNLEQAVSGTLSYAVGAGKPVISTPYAYAVELLADGRGMLVPAGSVDALSAALVRLLGDAGLRAAMGRRAYAYGRRMVWAEVGAAYRRLFARVVATHVRPAPLPVLRAPTDIAARPVVNA
jgi:glycosyltransferase involved in cell wall biosynthesis